MQRRRRLPIARAAGLGTAAVLLSVASVTCGSGGVPAHASTVSPPAGGPVSPSSWTVYHDDPAGDGAAPPVSAVDTATHVWTSPAVDGQIYGEPLVYAGHVFVATENDTVYALSAATGAVSLVGPSGRSGTRWIAALRGHHAHRGHHRHASHRPVTE